MLAIRRRGEAGGPALDRAVWRMAPLHRLPPLVLSVGARRWMLVLRLYLVAACALVVVRVVQLAVGQG